MEFLKNIKEIEFIIILFLLVSCTTKGVNSDLLKNNLTTVEFETKVIDFGVIHADTLLTAIYTFTNTGDDTLIIEYVNPDCSCTSYSISSKAIAPNETGDIKLIYDTKNRNGRKKIYAGVKMNTKNRFYRLLLILEIK